MGHHNVRVEISADRPEIGRIIWPDPRKTSKLFPKKMLTFVRPRSGGHLKIVFLHLGPKITHVGKVLRLLFLLRFGYHDVVFQKVQSQGFQKSIWSMGLFPAVKKLHHFEIPMGYC